MEPTNALCLNVKNLRIHRKKHCFGSILVILKRIKTKLFFLKNMHFQNPALCLDGNTIFKVSRPICSPCFECFLNSFLCFDFLIKHDNAQFYLQDTNLSLRYTCQLVLKQLEKSSKIGTTNDIKPNLVFQYYFHKWLPRRHGSSIFAVPFNEQ